MTPALAGAPILVANNFAGPGMGGGEVLALEVMRGLAEGGALVTAVAEPDSGFAQAARESGFALETVPMGLAHLAAAPRRVRSIAVSTGAQVLVGTGYLTNLIVRQAAPRGTKVANIVTVNPRGTLADGGTRAGLAVREALDRATRARCDAFVAVSQATADALASLGTPADRITVIPNAVDVAEIRAQSSEPLGIEPSEGRPVVGYLGRLATVKGAEYLVRAAEKIVRHSDALVLIAGEGPLDGDLRVLASALGVADRVRFAGRVTSPGAFLSACDVVVLPSLSEGMPLVPMEAMALGKPVVATTVGGTPEVVVEGETGHLVPPGDVAALADAVLNLLGDPQRAKAWGEAGYRRALERFDSEGMKSRYRDLVERLMVE